MAAQVALKRQQAAEDAIVLGLRACTQTRDTTTSSSESADIPMMTPGPLWGPGSVTKPQSTSVNSENSKPLTFALSFYDPVCFTLSINV